MDKRVKFDFEIYFTNGGSIKGEDFRLDITGVINVPFKETLELTEEHVKNHES